MVNGRKVNHEQPPSHEGLAPAPISCQACVVVNQGKNGPQFRPQTNAACAYVPPSSVELGVLQLHLGKRII